MCLYDRLQIVHLHSLTKSSDTGLTLMLANVDRDELVFSFNLVLRPSASS